MSPSCGFKLSCLEQFISLHNTPHEAALVLVSAFFCLRLAVYVLLSASQWIHLTVPVRRSNVFCTIFPARSDVFLRLFAPRVMYFWIHLTALRPLSPRHVYFYLMHSLHGLIPYGILPAMGPLSSQHVDFYPTQSPHG